MHAVCVSFSKEIRIKSRLEYLVRAEVPFVSIFSRIAPRWAHDPSNRAGQAARSAHAQPTCLLCSRQRIGKLLADARWILGLARKPSTEAVVGFQITDLALVGHRVLQDAHQAHSYRWSRVILGLIELSCELVSRY